MEYIGSFLNETHSISTCESKYGLKIYIKENKAVVDSVASNSPAEVSGFKKGDEIISVHNKRVTASNFNLLLQVNKQPIQVCYFRNNVLYTTKMEKKKNSILSNMKLLKITFRMMVEK